MYTMMLLEPPRRKTHGNQAMMTGQSFPRRPMILILQISPGKTFFVTKHGLKVLGMMFASTYIKSSFSTIDLDNT